MRAEVRALALATRGFLSEAEGDTLFGLAREISPAGPCVEIGSYCGRSTLFLAEGCRTAGGHPLFSIDHHRGSAEQQPGEAYFDPALLDPETQTVWTLDAFLRTVRRAGLLDWVIPVVTDSQRIGRYWPADTVSLLLIDGGHAEEDAFGDFHAWADRVLPGGYLCVHDVFPDPRDGGQAPFHVVERALSTGLWERVDQVETLGVLRRRRSARETGAVAAAGRAAGPAQPAGAAGAGYVALESSRHLGSFPCLAGDGWKVAGQDGGQSIDLGERTLFVFADTLLTVTEGTNGRGPAAHTESAFGSRLAFLANNAAIGTGRDIRETLAGLRYFADDAGRPREILEPTAEEAAAGLRFWPEHGIFVDGRVYLFYLGIHADDVRSTWGFQNVGVGLAVLDPDTGRCTRLSGEGGWCLWSTASDDFHLGVQVLREDEHVYVFGSSRVGMTTGARLGRVHVSRVGDPDAYEFLASPEPQGGAGGPASPGRRPEGGSPPSEQWSRDLADAVSLGPCAPDYSVSFNPYLGAYVLLYVEGDSKTLMMRTAPALAGPYGEPRRIASVSHRPTSELVYLGFEHPKFRQEDGRTVYVSYCQPRFAPNSLVRLRFA